MNRLITITCISLALTSALPLAATCIAVAVPVAHSADSAPLPNPLTPLAEALRESGCRFTPQVRASFLAQRKTEAVAKLAERNILLPAEFLNWVDATPVVASTVYGVRWGTPAQALVILRSLELDLGEAKLRKHVQMALATTVMNAAKVNLARPETAGFSLKERSLLEIKIPPCPLVKVDTHPTDRPLDINDHIINFFEEEEVISKDAAGNEVVVVQPRAKAIRACDVVAQRKLQEQFNAYMKRKGQKIAPLDCGNNELHWKFGGVSWRLPHVKEHTRAWHLFFGAYTAKGRLPAKRDPMPTPTQWLVYQVNNSETRGVRLPEVWPIAMYLVCNPLPLREAEFIWNEQARGIRPMRYIEYVGKVAQDPTKLKLRRLIPFPFGDGSYPQRRKNGGVCGTHTATSMMAGAASGAA